MKPLLTDQQFDEEIQDLHDHIQIIQDHRRYEAQKIERRNVWWRRVLRWINSTNLHLLMALSACVAIQADTINPTNKPTYYRLQKVDKAAEPPLPPSQVDPGEAIAIEPMVTQPIAPSARLETIIDISNLTILVLATNWSDIPPEHTEPLESVEYGMIVTNKTIQVLENGRFKKVIIQSYTNTVDVLTRSFSFQRVTDHGSVKRHVKRDMRFR